MRVSPHISVLYPEACTEAALPLRDCPHFRLLTWTAGFVLIGFSLFSPGLASAADAERGGQLFAERCVKCHGVNAEGIQEHRTPRLAGQREAYLRRQLKNFRSGVRGARADDPLGGRMREVASKLVEKHAVEDLIAYILTLDAPESPATISGRYVQGAEFYQRCQRCHRKSGEGWDWMKTPRIDQQHDWYLLRQLRNFRSGIRGEHPDDRWGRKMRSIALEIPENLEVDVIAYIKTLDWKD